MGWGSAGHTHHNDTDLVFVERRQLLAAALACEFQPLWGFIYENLADSSNTPDGSLGGALSHPSGSSMNIVFDLAGYLIAPVPEPGSMLLAATALIGFAALIRKRT